MVTLGTLHIIWARVNDTYECVNPPLYSYLNALSKLAYRLYINEKQNLHRVLVF